MATVTKYVDTDSGNDTTGDGSSGTPWASINKAIGQTSSNSGNDVIINCTGGAADTVGRIDGNGYTATSLTINGDTATDATYDTGRYRLEITDVTTAMIYWRSNGTPVTFNDFQIKLTMSSSVAGIVAGSGNTAGSKVTLVNCFMWAVNNTASSKAGSMLVENDADLSIVTVNCIIRLTGSLGTAQRGTSATHSNYGLVVDGSFDFGIYRGTNIKNCCSIGATDSYSTVGATVTTCFGDDSAGDSGVTNISDWTAEFTDQPNGDYSLKSTSPNILDGGTDVSSENGSISTDFIGTSRGATWDGGVWEYEAAGGTTIPVLMNSYRQRHQMSMG